jgi:hypothetical protein
MFKHRSEWFNWLHTVELIFDEPKHDAFENVLRKTPDQKPEEESLESKLLRAYARMKLKAEKIKT